MNKAFEKILERLDSYIEDVKSEGDFTYIKPFEIAKMAVQEVAEEYKGGWIPCSERLPEKNVEVLAITEWDTVTIAEMYSSNDWFIHEGTNNAKTDEIAAWMPLPEQYKAETEGEE